MAYYILNPNIALRSWRLVPCAYYIKGVRNAEGLKKDEFEFLSRCDGKTELESDSPLVKKFLDMRFIAPAQEGETLSEWQKLVCDNRYFPAINFAITEKCNYNCRHCFNAADNAPSACEWSLEDAKTLIGQAQKCGINAFTITGGEPMLHKNFFEIVEEIYKCGMYVDELNTNGHFLSQDALDRLKKTGCFPLVKISFDGVGHHDWLRSREGAEKSALAAIKLCIENGFRVKVQTNVHRLNVNSILPTAEMLDKMGVDEIRIIRTSESPRWRENAGDACLGIEEYFDEMLDFAEKYTAKPRNMDVDIWQFLTIFPSEKMFHTRPVDYGEGQYRDSLPVCRGSRGMVAIAADGGVFPCMQVSGCYKRRGFDLGNVKTAGLQPLLQSGDYLDEVCTTVKTLAENNPKCAECKYFKYCAGGCRTLAFALTDDKLGCDLTKCAFFKNGYYEKITRLFDGWENIAPMGV